MDCDAGNEAGRGPDGPRTETRPLAAVPLDEMLVQNDPAGVRGSGGNMRRGVAGRLDGREVRTRTDTRGAHCGGTEDEGTQDVLQRVL